MAEHKFKVGDTVRPKDPGDYGPGSVVVTLAGPPPWVVIGQDRHVWVRPLPDKACGRVYVAPEDLELAPAPVPIEAPKLPITLRTESEDPPTTVAKHGIALRLSASGNVLVLDPTEEEHLRQILNARACAAIDAVGRKT